MAHVEKEVVRQSLKTPCLLAFPAVLLLVALLGCANPVSSHVLSRDGPPSGEPPAAPREFRAAWVATVSNIDWPRSPGSPVDVQKAEARNLIARARALGLNTLILQVRPAADALYDSRLEPWSEYLTGVQGRPPAPRYDPLAFWIEEAHHAGLELHAWFNPFRARHASARSPLAPSHVGNTHPEWVKQYGDQLWLDPGEPGAAEHVLAVILDVVHRYDVDGVHLDDYFYPYPIKDGAGQKVEFPDHPSWQAYLSGGGTLTQADWRRSQVDHFMERLYRQVHREKPQVRVGVSPFGIGRPDRRPAGMAGFSQYDELYADAERWLEQGWLDYLVPQLYWKMDSAEQPFGPLLDYWRAQNPMGRHVGSGLFTSRTGGDDPWPVDEILGQIRLTRSRAGSFGHAHFSMAALMKNQEGIADALAAFYGGPALVPASGWLVSTPPGAPVVRLRNSGADPTLVQIELQSGDRSCLLAVWGRYGSTWRFFTVPGGSGAIPAQSGGSPLGPVVVSSVGGTGLESPRGTIKDERH
jgi:uncharacterized lipoprotein YddW (UPF0748 family)